MASDTKNELIYDNCAVDNIGGQDCAANDGSPFQDPFQNAILYV